MNPVSRIVLAMSGGVDSSVAAHLLRQEGWEVVGVTFDLWPEVAQAAIDDARHVAGQLGISHRVLSLRDEFLKQVVEPFCRDYFDGRTPNPCVRCNPLIKFNALLRLADELGADAVATGHYARVEHSSEHGEPLATLSSAGARHLPAEALAEAGAAPLQSGKAAMRGRYFLRRACDAQKDQSYMLYGLEQRHLARARFPVGELSKPEVRKLAQAAGLKSHNRPDSQEICFIPDDDYAAFLERQAPEGVRAGEIRDTLGKVLARHKGIHRFTIGQRKKLGFAAGEPRFVVRLEPENAVVVVGRREETMRGEFMVRGINWIYPVAAGERFAADVKIRYRHRGVAAQVEALPDAAARVRLSAPEPAVTPGQAAVFYDGECVIGGGTISDSSTC